MACCRNSSAITEGTVFSNVTPVACAGILIGLVARMTRPLQHKGANISKTDKSKQIEVEASTPARSSLLNVEQAQLMKVAALWWQMLTPFGIPVEPEV